MTNICKSFAVLAANFPRVLETFFKTDLTIFQKVCNNNITEKLSMRWFFLKLNMLLCMNQSCEIKECCFDALILSIWGSVVKRNISRRYGSSLSACFNFEKSIIDGTRRH